MKKYLGRFGMLLLAVYVSNLPLAAYAQAVPDGRQSTPRDFAEGMQRIDAESYRYLVKVYAVQNPENPLETMGTGSGELVRSTGGVVRILTNAHVVGEARSVMVQFEKERFAQEVAVLGVDKLVDLALLEAPRPLPVSAHPIAIAKNPVSIGDAVYTGGYPYGARNITGGFVTSLSSPQSDLFFSHQAPIAPGNSGGALVRFTNSGEQELVGINTQVVMRPIGPGTMVISLGMSIKAPIIGRMMGKLESEHFVTHAFFGFAVEDAEYVNPYFFKSVGGRYPPQRPGIVVTKVANNSPASRAGILPGDIIQKFQVQINGQWFDMPSNNAAELSETVFFDVAAGTSVRVLTSRGGQDIGREFTLETYPEKSSSPHS